MAKYLSTSFQDYGYPQTLFYKVVGPITTEDVLRINKIQKKVILVLPNTKGQSPSIIRQIQNPNVSLSISGGIDYLNKKKFQDSEYIDRTILPPNVLASVIEYFEKIEKNIRYTWTERQKCMFVYKTLVEQLHYKYQNESEYENGHDVVRSLEGLLYGKLVCSGFALVFKEAMDRIGIPCIYQNRSHHHSWNIIQLDEKNYAMDLTWDCSHKNENNACGFCYFGRSKDFYQNPHHDVSNESEEIAYPLDEFDLDELSQDLSTISHNGIIEKREMYPVSDSDGKILFSPFQKRDDGVYPYIIYLYDEPMTIYTNKDSKHLYSSDVFRAIENNGIDPDLQKDTKHTIETYQRTDGSKFFIKKSKNSTDSMGEYYYFDIQMGPNGPMVRRGTLLSELDLSYSWDSDMKHNIANSLLNSDRLKRKILHYHGYVGYIGKDMNTHYNRKFEEESLQVVERV